MATKTKKICKNQQKRKKKVFFKKKTEKTRKELNATTRQQLWIKYRYLFKWLLVVIVAVALVGFAYFRFLLLALFATTNQSATATAATHTHAQNISCRKVKKRQQVHEGRTTIQHRKTDKQNRLSGQTVKYRIISTTLLKR